MLIAAVGIRDEQSNLAWLWKHPRDDECLRLRRWDDRSDGESEENAGAHGGFLVRTTSPEWSATHNITVARCSRPQTPLSTGRLHTAR
jgi:hypothetical protein